MNLIEVTNLEKTYQSGEFDVKVLKGVSFDIAEGEYVSLIGQSGSGKSTLMHILGCLDTPTEGQYILNEQDVSSLSDDQLSHIRNRSIGFVFQSFNLLNRQTILRNVQLPMLYNHQIPKKDRDERAKYYLEKVGLSHRLDHKPGQLSGGERQRVAIARSLVNQPKVLFADEPTGNLDSKVRQEILDLFEQLNKEMNITIVMVTHDNEIASSTPRCIRLKDGLIENWEMGQ